MCVEKSLTTLHAICFVVEAGKMSQEDVHTFKILMEYFGPELSNYCMLILTHCDRFKNERLEAFKKDIASRADVKPVIDFCKLGIFFHGILDKDDLDQYDDEELRNNVKASKLNRLAPMRAKLIQKLIDQADSPCQMRQLSELEAGSRSARRQAFVDAWKRNKCCVM